MSDLILSILCSAAIAVIMRFAAGRQKNQSCLLASNYAVCVLCGLFYLSPGSAGHADFPYTLVLSFIAGILFFASLKMLQLNIGRNGVILSSAFNKLGVVVPTLTAILIFGERPGFCRITGILLALLSILLLNLWKPEARPGGTGNGKAQTNKLLLILLMMTAGLSGTMSSIFERTADGSLKSLYLVVGFGTACLLSAISAVMSGAPVSVNDFAFGIALGIPNYFSTRFLLNALSKLDAVIVYPTSCVGVIGITTLLGALVFNEKLEREEIVALVMIAAALFLINL